MTIFTAARRPAALAALALGLLTACEQAEDPDLADAWIDPYGPQALPDDGDDAPAAKPDVDPIDAGNRDGTLVDPNGAASAGCIDDNYEDNDTPERAHPLAGGFFPMQLCDADWFGVELLAGDTITLEATFDREQRDLAVLLTDPMTGERLHAERTADGRALEARIEHGGTWLLQVDVADKIGATPDSAYVLSLDVEELDCAADRFEPNDSDLSPWPLQGGSFDGLQLCPSGDDYFAVWLEPGESMTVTASFDVEEADIDLSAYDPTLLLLDASASPDDGTESVSVTATQAGYHVVRVELVDDLDEPGAGYELAIAAP